MKPIRTPPLGTWLLARRSLFSPPDLPAYPIWTITMGFTNGRVVLLEFADKPTFPNPPTLILFYPLFIEHERLLEFEELHPAKPVVAPLQPNS